MKFRFLSFLVITIGIFSSSHAHAFMFGKDESIHEIQDVKVTGPAGEPLFLGYKTTIQYFLLGLYVTDDGYVLGMRSDHDKYFNLPADELKQFQDEGLLPNPLPSYKLGITDYLLGYSAWIALPIIVIVYFVGWMRKRNAPETSASTAPSAGPPSTS